MKYFAIALALLATPSAADTTVYGRITHVEPVYSNNYVDIPQTVCYDVEVPATGHAETGNVIAGAIIGGAIGNQFGGGSGQDAATVLGAIIGADIANKHNRQVFNGYRMERRCDTQYVTDVQYSISGWTVYYTWSGGHGSFDTDRDNYIVGDRILLNVTAY